jgi:NitT/TauT family transport system ATP-binding protein
LPSIIEVKDVWKDFDLPNGQLLHVLEKINLALNPGEVVAIIGPSGCGKSTLLRIIAGLIPATKGTIFHHGKQLETLMTDIAIIFQNFALYPWMTVRENVEMVLKAIHMPKEQMAKKTMDAIALIGLIGFEEAFPRELSGGMKQRVGIARALVKSPEVLFMDEPFSNLDTFTAEALRSEVIKIWSDQTIGVKSILLISHDMMEVAFMADRIIVLGANPATIQKVIENKIPRPRNYRSPEFLALVDQLHDFYARIEPSGGPKPKLKKEKIGPLLSALPEEISAFLIYLHSRGGSQDMFRIGAESHQQIDKVAVILEAAELLGFAEITQRISTITPIGTAYLTAGHSERRKMWKKQLLTIPLFIQATSLCKKTPGKTLNKEEFIRFLNKELPYQDASAQFSIFVRWAHFGDLFTYSKITRRLSLV